MRRSAPTVPDDLRAADRGGTIKAWTIPRRPNSCSRRCSRFEGRSESSTRQFSEEVRMKKKRKMTPEEQEIRAARERYGKDLDRRLIDKIEEYRRIIEERRAAGA